jgi:hypothetical protein
MKFPSDYKTELLKALDTVDLNLVNQAIELFKDARANGRQIFVCGNGGSASTASHFACDIVKGASYNRNQRFRIMALTDQLPTITAYANDVSYDSVFVEPLRNFAQPSDLVMGISGWWQQIANWPGFRPRSTRTERDSHRSSEHTRKVRWANFTKRAAASGRYMKNLIRRPGVESDLDNNHQLWLQLCASGRRRETGLPLWTRMTIGSQRSWRRRSPQSGTRLFAIVPPPCSGPTGTRTPSVLRYEPRKNRPPAPQLD